MKKSTFLVLIALLTTMAQACDIKNCVICETDLLCSRCKYGFDRISKKAENGIVMDICDERSTFWSKVGKVTLFTLLALGIAALLYYMIKDFKKKKKVSVSKK